MSARQSSPAARSGPTPNNTHNPLRGPQHAHRTGRRRPHRRLPRGDARRAGRSHVVGRGRRRSRARRRGQNWLGVECDSRRALLDAGHRRRRDRGSHERARPLVVGGPRQASRRSARSRWRRRRDPPAVLDRVTTQRRAGAHRVPAAFRRRATSPGAGGPASSAESTPCGPAPSTLAATTGTSRGRAASSGTAACTTSTASAG